MKRFLQNNFLDVFQDGYQVAKVVYRRTLVAPQAVCKVIISVQFNLYGWL